VAQSGTMAKFNFGLKIILFSLLVDKNLVHDWSPTISSALTMVKNFNFSAQLQFYGQHTHTLREIRGIEFLLLLQPLLLLREHHQTHTILSFIIFYLLLLILFPFSKKGRRVKNSGRRRKRGKSCYREFVWQFLSESILFKVRAYKINFWLFLFYLFKVNFDFENS